MSAPATTAPGTVSVRVTSLHVYPVKSLAGIDLQASDLLPTGLPHDREWMLLNHRGRFMTQREQPRLALIRTRLAEDGVILSREGRGAAHLPFESQAGERIRTRIWQDECEVVEVGQDASRWLGAALDLDPAPRIVRLAPGARRPQSRPERYGAGTSTLFADGAPYLIVNQASLRALNEALERQGLAAVPMDRFRPNIVVEDIAPADLPAFAEHRVDRLRGPDFDLGLRYPCQRCVVTTVDQATGIADPDQQPWRTLREIHPMPDPGSKPGAGKRREAAFGVNAVLETGLRLPTIRTEQRMTIEDRLA